MEETHARTQTHTHARTHTLTYTLYYPTKPLAVFEQWLFSQASRLKDDKSQPLVSATSESAPALSDFDAALEQYRLLARQLEGAAAATGGVVPVELRSRAVLVVWVLFCFADQSARLLHPAVCEDFGVALDWRQLGHLVLGDRLATAALLAVADYLKRRAAGRPPVWSLRADDATLSLALAYSRASPRIGELWADERADAAQRREKHWAEVQRKQALARKLRVELASLESEERQLRSKKDAAKRKLAQNPQPHKRLRNDEDFRESIAHSTANDAYIAAESIWSDKDRQVKSKEAELTEAEKAPTAVIEPLPAAESSALQALFFLHMPLSLRVLSRLAFTAQQMLVPRVGDETGRFLDACKVEAPKAVWSAHYNKSQVSCYHTPAKNRQVRRRVCI